MYPFLEWGRGLFEKVSRYLRKPGALCDGIRAMNWENSRKVVTGSRIVSPLGTVRKSNMPALSTKDLSLVWCRLLRKFVGSILKQVFPSQKCSMLRVG